MKLEFQTIMLMACVPIGLFYEALDLKIRINTF